MTDVPVLGFGERWPRLRVALRRIAALSAGSRTVVCRSIYPFAALAILLGTTLWGPWVSLVVVIAWWKLTTRIA